MLGSYSESYQLSPIFIKSKHLLSTKPQNGCKNTILFKNYGYFKCKNIYIFVKIEQNGMENYTYQIRIAVILSISSKNQLSFAKTLLNED